MQCSLCKIKDEKKIEEGALCNFCGRFFCSNCYTIKEKDGVKFIYCKLCERTKISNFPIIIFSYPIFSYLFFFVIYYFIKDYVGKHLIIFFSIPFISFLPLYFDFKTRKPFNPPVLFYLFIYLLSLMPWFYSTIILMRLYR